MIKFKTVSLLFVNPVSAEKKQAKLMIITNYSIRNDGFNFQQTSKKNNDVSYDNCYDML